MPVYKQYSQEELDLQYNNRYHVPDFETSLTSWESLSRQAEKRYRVIKDIPYGSVSRESLDVFPSPLPGSKTLIFIHGGYWQMFDKSSFHFVAGAFAEYGITTVLLNYPLAPTASIDQIVLSCSKAIHWLKKNLHQLNGNPEQMYVVGHSAGGHLAAMLMIANGHDCHSLLRGVVSISGLFNLIPIQSPGLIRYYKWMLTTAARNSPVREEPGAFGSLLLVVGSSETDEFKDQSRELYARWTGRMNSIELLEIKGLNHFSILDSLHVVDSLLHKAVCDFLH